MPNAYVTGSRIAQGLPPTLTAADLERVGRALRRALESREGTKPEAKRNAA